MASIYHPSIVPDQYRAVDKIFGLGVLIWLPKAARPAGSAAPGIGKGVRSLNDGEGACYSFDNGG